MFCDISNAFDKVWHHGLLLKLKSVGIDGYLLKWFESYLSNRAQKVTINSAESNSKLIEAGVHQGSILGPLLFLIYNNDLVSNLTANARLFADDTSLYVLVDNPQESAVILNDNLNRIDSWASHWHAAFNPSKTVSIIFSRKVNKPIHPPLYMQGQKSTDSLQHKHLGMTLSHDCGWKQSCKLH